MRDLTKNNLSRHLSHMTIAVGVGLVIQTLYLLIDLYFVAQLGEQALAGVAMSGSIMLLVMALSQVISVGGLSLISHEAGKENAEQAQFLVEQVVTMSICAFFLMIVIGYTLGYEAIEALAPDRKTALAGQDFLSVFLPGLALMFPSAAFSAILRASGLTGWLITLQATVVIVTNAVLTPILISGWGTGIPLGVVGAGLASTVGAVAGVGVFAFLFGKLDTQLYLAMRKPDFAVWSRIIFIGFPAAFELIMMFSIIGVAYWALRSFGAETQAAFAIGSRVMQAVLLPVMAIAYSAAPVAGQNFGAGKFGRVQETWRLSILWSTGITMFLVLICQMQPKLIVGVFTTNEDIRNLAADYLILTSWNFIPTGLILCCSAMLQAVGRTTPSYISSSTRIFTFIIPVLILSYSDVLTPNYIWRISNVSVFIQMTTSLILLYLVFRKALPKVNLFQIKPANI